MLIPCESKTGYKTANVAIGIISSSANIIDYATRFTIIFLIFNFNKKIKKKKSYKISGP